MRVWRVWSSAVTAARAAAVFLKPSSPVMAPSARSRAHHKPDVFVVPREIARAAIIEESPGLIPGTELYLTAEVISPGSGSERTDRLRKVSEYARLGIPQFWIVEHAPRLSVQVLTLADGTYTAAPVATEGARLEAVIDADKPFTVSFDPADLLDF